MKKILLSIFALASASFANAQCTELFFSEYIPATGNNKALEVYNPTASAINLSGYSIKRYRNGGTTASETLLLSGSIPAYGTWVVTNGQTADIVTPPSPKCDPALQALANQKGDGVYNDNGGGDPLYFNGDDAITLEKSGNYVDIIGKVGEQPTTAWSTISPYTGGTGMGTWITHNYQLVKKASIKTGVTTNPSQFNPLASWDTLALTPRNNWTKLGAHSCECDPNGIAKINSNDDLLVVYPNPTNGNVTIDAGKLITSVKVFNMIGESFISAETSNTKVVVETEKLNKGVYFVLVTYTDKSVSTSRFIKE